MLFFILSSKKDRESWQGNSIKQSIAIKLWIEGEEKKLKKRPRALLWKSREGRAAADWHSINSLALQIPVV